jgi:hypothetical protein
VVAEAPPQGGGGMISHLSPSSMSMLLHKCGRQFYYRYIEGLVIPSGVAAVRGSAAHAGVEHNLRNVMSCGCPAPLEDVLDATRDALNTGWQSGVRLIPEEQETGEEKVRGVAVDDAARLVTAHYNEVAPSLKPVAVERWWELTVPGYPYTVKGRIDIQEESGLRDTKTTGSSPAADAADNSLQLSWYGLALRTIDGQAPDYVSLDYLVLNKTKVTCKTMQSKRGDQDYRRALSYYQEACQLIEAGIFTSADPESWVCSPKWCGYWNLCPQGSRGSTTVSYAVTGRESGKEVSDAE